MKEKILITGSEGIIGKIISKTLNKKYNIIGIDIKDKSSLEEYCKLDISDLNLLNKTLENINCAKKKHIY